MKAIIFANGEYRPTDNQINIIEDELIIAADGGSAQCAWLGIIPDILIGDLDSTDPDLIQKWEAAGVKVIRYPADKDQTDLELALLHAQAEGADKIVVYGAIGGRLDMTFGNLTLLAHPALKILVKLVYGEEVVRLLREGELLTLPGAIGDTISLIALDSRGAFVTTTGLEFPLDKEVLEFGLTKGISNRFVKKQATIYLERGLLAVIHSQQDPLEEK
ncbi:MAG: thiamine diphosphokinase [Anaerolineales bacterium]